MLVHLYSINLPEIMVHLKKMVEVDEICNPLKQLTSLCSCCDVCELRVNFFIQRKYWKYFGTYNLAY